MADCCDRLDRMFDAKTAERDLRDYLRGGPDRSTRMLVRALAEGGVADRTLLDIGGGIGAVQLELLAAGAASATDVDISAGYIGVARREAERRGLTDRTAYRQGDFAAIADTIGAADLVALDRVICCYPDLEALTRRAADHARERLGVVHPQDRWWLRAGAAAMNTVGRLFRRPLFYVHRTARLEAILLAAGLEREQSAASGLWRVAVYRRVSPIAT
jgi:magnesium-protoporphyrin O-methyltransferase